MEGGVAGCYVQFDLLSDIDLRLVMSEQWLLNPSLFQSHRSPARLQPAVWHVHSFEIYLLNPSESFYSFDVLSLSAAEASISYIIAIFGYAL